MVPMDKYQETEDGADINLRLLNVPKYIIEKYKGLAESGKLLSVSCYPNCKNEIKILVIKCVIDKKMTWKIAVYSYVIIICFSNNVSIETLSQVLGYCSIRTAHIYAMITADMFSDDMDKLAM